MYSSQCTYFWPISEASCIAKFLPHLLRHPLRNQNRIQILILIITHFLKKIGFSFSNFFQLNFNTSFDLFVHINSYAFWHKGPILRIWATISTSSALWQDVYFFNFLSQIFLREIGLWTMMQLITNNNI